MHRTVPKGIIQPKLSIVPQLRNSSLKVRNLQVTLPGPCWAFKARQNWGILKVPSWTCSSERTLHIQGLWPAWRAIGRHAPNAPEARPRDQLLKLVLFILTFEVGGFAPFVPSVGSIMIFRIINALTCLGLARRSQFLPKQGVNQGDAALVKTKCFCHKGFHLGWAETPIAGLRRNRYQGQMNQPHLCSCWVSLASVSRC